MDKNITLIDNDDVLVVAVPRKLGFGGWRRYDAHSRVYVWATGEAETVLDDLANRTRRPHAAWRKALLPVLAQCALPTTNVRWSQYAGCTCPCSPGFVLPELVRIDGWRMDFTVTIKGVPTVDAAKPAREVVAAV